ncbi:hypothetical protein SDC9_05991 [bioreactor metagenome]|uniref:Prepilin-type N-terminal cleavage/methylation domain-containing protein n=1 Tax=bioreactor metagenome TaxID=1076179 RepID=A0A644T0F6_9ZZZZ|nr:prepilin-type N-terminal cleavage/methylation domain-containing protein [Negativicutes bacterium]
MKLANHSNNQHGLTLIELVIAMTLTVLLLTALFTLLSTSLKAWTLGGSKTEVQHTARYCIDTLTRDLQFASEITLINDKSLDLVTDQYQTTKKKVNYTNNTVGQIGILYKDINDGSPRQPLTGGPNSPISVAVLFKDLTPLSSPTRSIGITLTATDINTKQNFTIETAVSSMLIH